MAGNTYSVYTVINYALSLFGLSVSGERILSLSRMEIASFQDINLSVNDSKYLSVNCRTMHVHINTRAHLKQFYYSRLVVLFGLSTIR